MKINCIWDGCDRGNYAKGYCSKHYYSAQRHGLLSRPECSVDGCSSPSFRKGMCNTHNIRSNRHGDPLVRKKLANGEAMNTKCEVEGCGMPQKGAGLCSTHYGRKRHHGDPNAQPKKLGNGQCSPERKRENAARAMKNYAQTPHGKMRRRFNVAKRRVLAGGSSIHIKKDEFLALWSVAECAICHSPMSDYDKTIDHRIPLARGGANDIHNLQMAHLACNQRKSDRLIAA